MPNRILEEQNIDENLAHFQQHGQSQPIQAWRQRIENEEARLARRKPNTIIIEQAVKDFRQALLGDPGQSETAQALFRELLRPAQPRMFRVVDAWRLQNPAYRPASLTPEEQAYVEWYDQCESERRRWEVEISTERWDRWGTLEDSILDCKDRAKQSEARGNSEDAKHFQRLAERARTELHADLAKVGEQWMAENPELARKLVDQFIGQSWVKPVPTKAFKEYLNEQFAKRKAAFEERPYFFSEAWAVSGTSNAAQEQAYYKGRLFFIAANLILKHFGFNDAVAGSVIQDIQRKAFSCEWDYGRLVGTPDESEQDSESNQDKKVLACHVVAGRVYLNLYEQLQPHGADFIPILEEHISDALTEILKDPDQLNDRSVTPFSMVAADYDKKNRNRDGDNLDKALWERTRQFRHLTSPEMRELAEEERQEHYQRTDDLRAILPAFKDQLNSRQLSILLLRNNEHTHESIAQQLELNPKTIQRELRKIEVLAERFRSQRHL